MPDSDGGRRKQGIPAVRFRLAPDTAGRLPGRSPDVVLDVMQKASGRQDHAVAVECSWRSRGKREGRIPVRQSEHHRRLGRRGSVQVKCLMML